MLLAYNANSATIAANLGKWRPNAANPTGLYVPNLSEQFFRAWTGAGGAGEWHRDEMRNVTGQVHPYCVKLLGLGGAFYAELATGSHSEGTTEETSYRILKFDASRVVPTGPENVPAHVLQPVMIYLGNHV